MSKNPKTSGAPTWGGKDHDGVPLRGWLSAGNLASGREIAIPYLIRNGRREGPCLWINAAVHGDEINGVFAALGFLQEIASMTINGTVIVTPVSNVLALDERRKATMNDGIDMDQSFPGRVDGFATERVAHALFEKFGRQADVIVNLHTLGTPYDAKPYAVYKAHQDVPEDQLLRMIRCFDPMIACRMPVSNAPGELPGNIAGALDYQGLVHGRTAFMIELGGGGRLEPDAIEHGVKGLMRLAADLGVLAESSRVPSPRTGNVRRVTARAHRLASKGGFFRSEASPGTTLRAGQRLGVVYDVFGDVVEEIVGSVDSWIIAVRRDPVVHTGDRCAFLATEWDDVEISD